MSFFYEIRSTTDTVLKRDSGFPDSEAATEAARADTKRLKAVPKPPQVGRILVGQVTDKPTVPLTPHQPHAPEPQSADSGPCEAPRLSCLFGPFSREIFPTIFSPPVV